MTSSRRTCTATTKRQPLCATSAWSRWRSSPRSSGGAPARAAAWTLGLIAAAMLAFWLGGRPGVARIYIAPLGGAVLLTLATHPALRVRRAEGLVVGAALLAATAALAVRNAADSRQAQHARTEACALPKERLYVVWGDSLPYDKLYPPLSAPRERCELRTFALGVYSYAPYAVQQLRAATGQDDVVAALLAGKELDMIAQGPQVDVLRRHLRLHYGRILQWRLLRGDGGKSSWFSLRLAPAPR